MIQSKDPQERVRAAIVLLATVGTIAFNALAAMGYVNGITPDMISKKYETIITPAGYAFSIWSLIYLGITAFSIYQMLPSQLARFRGVRTIYVISCLFNCGWIYFWHRDQTAICMVLIVGLLITLVMILIKLRDAASPGSALLTKAPFGIYAGWVTAASIVSIAILLKAQNVEMSAAVWNIFGAVGIILAAALAVVARVWIKNYVYPLAVAWAVSAIAVKQSGNTPIVVAAAFAAVICLVTSGSIVTSLKDSTSE